MATTRNASTHWEGTLFEGAGKVTLESSGTGTYDVSWASRAEDANGKTSPEELIAAAHSSCFSMALSNGLAKAGTPATSLDTSAAVDFVPGTGITEIRLSVKGVVPGMSEEDFVAAAEGAKVGCPVSQALAAVPIKLEASLALTRTSALDGLLFFGRGARSAPLVLAVPDHPLREGDLDALVVEAGLDPLTQLAGDRPLLERRGLDQHPQRHRVGGEGLDTGDLRLLDDHAGEVLVVPQAVGDLAEDPLDLGQVLAVGDPDVDDGPRPVLAHVADPHDGAVRDVPDRAVQRPQPGDPEA